MSNNKFMHNDLRYYVRFLFDFTGRDIRFMAPGYEDVIQAERETIENMLEQEDRLNADHMETYWLHYDKVLTAVNMRESDGYTSAKDIESFYNEKSNQKGKAPSKAYIGLARVNAERSKGHMKNVPVDFEAVPNFPSRDKEAVAGLNHYRSEILNRNNWTTVKDLFIDDLHDFGSGIVYNPYREMGDDPDMTFFEERIEQGEPLEWEEYLRFEELAKSHVMEYVDTFEVIRDRRARGAASMDFNNPCHTIATWMQNIPITKAMQQYPKYAEQIRASGISEVYKRVNPRSGQLNNDDVMITCKYTWVVCPVNYMREIKVHLGGGRYTTRKKWRSRNAIIRFKRFENVGIVDAEIDRYNHNQIPLTMGQRRPSKIHAYGIGAYKDMWAPEWAYNIAFNGKFDWFNRSAKGVRYALKGLISQDQIDAASKSWHGVVEIDPEKLGGKYKGATLDQLIKTDYPQNVPTVFANFEATMENMVNRASGWHDVAGQAAGISGRHELALKNQSEMGMENPIRNMQGAFLLMGKKFFRNIVQFDGDRPIKFEKYNPSQDSYDQVELNKPVGEIPEWDPETGSWKMLAYEIKNSLKSFEYTTQISARSMVPVNPTEQRLFWNDLILNHQNLFMSEEGLVTMEMLDEKVLGGILAPYLKRQRDLFERRAQQQQELGQEELRQQQEQREFDNAIKMAETIQNRYRLEKKAASDLMNAISKFSKGDPRPLRNFLSDNPQMMDMVKSLEAA